MEREDVFYILGILKNGDQDQLEELTLLVDDFPDGTYESMGRSWIVNAIGCGASLQTIEWILKRQVDLAYQDGEGYTALHTTLVSKRPDRLSILALLLRHHAPVDWRGPNDWTPAHTAAVDNDVEALRLLIAHGADLSLRTRIDSYATPLEEAQYYKRADAVRFLEDLMKS